MSTADTPRWRTIAPSGRCSWGCGKRTTHVVEWPPGSVETNDSRGGPRPFDGQVRTYACADDAMKIEVYQRSIGVDVVVREVGEGKA